MKLQFIQNLPTTSYLNLWGGLLSSTKTSYVPWTSAKLCMTFYWTPGVKGSIAVNVTTL